MAIKLYRQGNTHKENGIQCEMQVTNEYSFMSLISSGVWFLSPEEAYGVTNEEKADKPEEETNEEKVETQAEEGVLATDVTHEMSESQIRAMAKDKKIRNWHNMKIEKLRKKLNDTQD